MTKKVKTKVIKNDYINDYILMTSIIGSFPDTVEV